MNTNFKFRLQKVLDYRETVEIRKKEEMAKALKHLEEEKRALSTLMDEKECTFFKMNDRSNKGISAGYLVQYNKYLESLNVFIDKQKANLGNAEKNVEECRGNLIKASRNKRIMYKLKDKCYDRFVYQLNRDQEKEVEDIVNFNTIKA